MINAGLEFFSFQYLPKLHGYTLNETKTLFSVVRGIGRQKWKEGQKKAGQLQDFTDYICHQSWLKIFVNGGRSEKINQTGVSGEILAGKYFNNS